MSNNKNRYELLEEYKMLLKRVGFFLGEDGINDYIIPMESVSEIINFLFLIILNYLVLICMREKIIILFF
jgi:hypothetical protein